MIKNFSVVSVDKAVSMLTDLYGNAIKTGTDFKSIPSVMLWGPPGVGKSQGIREVAQRVGKETGKKVVVTDVRLILFNPIDLRGIPSANADKTLAVWLKPKIFQMDESTDVVNILFLDEISAAPQTVQAAAYQITLDRIIGEHRLPDNCLVIAAGNRVTDKSVSYKMPKALANRLMHFEIEGSFASWRTWAVNNGINDKVISYLASRNDRLFRFDASTDELAFPTPRSWEMVSKVLTLMDNDEKAAKNLISGLIGSGEAVEFISWCNIYKEYPSIEHIFKGSETFVPKNTDTLYAVVYGMAAYAREHLTNKAAIGNSLSYAGRMPFDFAKLLILTYKAFENEEMERYLLTIPEYVSIMKRMGELTNGY